MNRSMPARRSRVLLFLVASLLLVVPLVLCSNGLRAFIKHCRITIKGGDVLVRQDPETWGSAWFEQPQSQGFIVHLNSAEINAATMQLLAEYRLSRLSLGDSTLSQEAISGLGNLQVQSLFLDRANIDDQALSHLCQSTTLRSLSLAGTRVTDSGLRCLRSLTNLEFLDLSETEVTDVGLTEISHFQDLQEVSLFDTLVTPEGIRALRRDRPDLLISTDLPTEEKGGGSLTPGINK